MGSGLLPCVSGGTFPSSLPVAEVHRGLFTGLFGPDFVFLPEYVRVDAAFITFSSSILCSNSKGHLWFAVRVFELSLILSLRAEPVPTN